jgi:protein-tyrosine phosphatase
METRSRLVALERSFNFRDLGGYVGHQGMVTRWGTLFRSDTLHELTGPDVETLRSLGLATIVDLRTRRELEHTGRGPLADESMAFRHLSLIRDGEGEAMAAPAPPGDELSLRYGWYLEGGRDSLVAALLLLADPVNLPLVFHCAAGKDRTGVLAALVLDILGVAPEVIVADYVITAERMPMILDRYRSDPALAARMDQVPATRFSVEARTMERFLADLYHRFGGARGWALAAGVGADQLDRIGEQLLVGPHSGTSAPTDWPA